MLGEPVGRRTTGQIKPGDVSIEVAARQHHQPLGFQGSLIGRKRLIRHGEVVAKFPMTR